MRDIFSDLWFRLGNRLPSLWSLLAMNLENIPLSPMAVRFALIKRLAGDLPVVLNVTIVGGGVEARRVPALIHACHFDMERTAEYVYRIIFDGD